MERRQTVISSYETVQVVAALLLGTGLSLWFETSLKPPREDAAAAPGATCPAEAGARAARLPPAWEAWAGSWLTTLMDESTSLLLVLFTALNLFGLLTLSPQLFYMRQALSRDRVLFDPFCEQLKILRQDAIFSILYSMPLLVLILGLMALRGRGLAPRAGGVLLLVLAVSGTRIITLTRATFRGLRLPIAKKRPKHPHHPTDGASCDRSLHALWLDVFRRVLLVQISGTESAPTRRASLAAIAEAAAAAASAAPSRQPSGIDVAAAAAAAVAQVERAAAIATPAGTAAPEATSKPRAAAPAFEAPAESAPVGRPPPMQAAASIDSRLRAATDTEPSTEPPAPPPPPPVLLPSTQDEAPAQLLSTALLSPPSSQQQASQPPPDEQQQQGQLLVGGQLGGQPSLLLEMISKQTQRVARERQKLLMLQQQEQWLAQPTPTPSQAPTPPATPLKASPRWQTPPAAFAPAAAPAAASSLPRWQPQSAPLSSSARRRAAGKLQLSAWLLDAGIAEHELEHLVARLDEQMVISVELLRGCWAEVRPALPAAARAKIGGALGWDSAEAARSGLEPRSGGSGHQQQAADVYRAPRRVALRYD